MWRPITSGIESCVIYHCSFQNDVSRLQTEVLFNIIFHFNRGTKNDLVLTSNNKKTTLSLARLLFIYKYNCLYVYLVGLEGTCSPRDPSFAGSNASEVDGFFQDVKVLSTSLLNNLKTEKIGLWAKFNRHIHVLNTYIRRSTIALKRSQCIGQQWPPLQYNTIQYNPESSSCVMYAMVSCMNGEWRRIHNKELHSFYRSPNAVKVIKSRRLRWASDDDLVSICMTACSIKIMKYYNIVLKLFCIFILF